jgi:ATP-binding cassette subfamily B protein
MSTAATTRPRRRNGRPRSGAWSFIPLGIGTVGTFVLAMTAAIGRFAVPIVAQQVVDGGVLVPHPGATGAAWYAISAGAAAVIASVATAYLLHSRIAQRNEVLLDVLRRRAFRAKPPQSSTWQQAARQAIDDVEQTSQFVRWTGPAYLTSCATLAVATIVLFVYSWQLALAVLVAFVLLVPVQRRLARILAALHEQIRASADRIRDRLAEIVARREPTPPSR